ncbi:MAG: mismatch-specific DNA-glycosylase, partial [Pyrinomonadaceae bacterium]
MNKFKPTKEDLRDATNRTVEDLIDYNLKVLFCGINPGIWSGATGLHFAKPGNRFWKTLHLAGFTNRLLHPSEELELLENGYGIT